MYFKKNNMRTYPSAILLHMDHILEVREQLRKCCSHDFSGPAYSRILIDMFKFVIDVSELAPFLEEMKFP